MKASPGVWLIAGPTASGKSALALTLAEASGGEIINADSMQLYRDLRILTARPTPAEEARAPHRLFGVADAAEAWSVGRWLRAALPVIDGCRDARRPAIVVGGTGLYFNALTRGLVELPAIPESARSEAETLLARDGEAAFREALRRLDPLGEAAIGPADRQRLVRAHAVAASTGRPLSGWKTDTKPPLPNGAWRGVVLEPPRAKLYARCDARLEAMVGAGAVEEVRALMARGLDPALPSMKALGVRELAAHLSGELTLEAAVASAQRATRNYAKRQSTWFRNQTPDWPRVEQANTKMVLAMLTVTFQDQATESAHF